MRSLISLVRVFALLSLPVAVAFAQQPPNLQPLPADQIPPPPQIKIDPSKEPVVTTFQRGEDKVEEFRIGGKLYMIRVTPPKAPPYVLVDQDGTGKFGPGGGPADATHLSVPMWVIGTF